MEPTMKTLCKLAIAFSMLVVITGCTGTAYNKDRTCGADYLLHPAISIPAIIGACDAHDAK